MKRLLVFCIFIISLTYTQDAQAFIYSAGGEKITVIEEMPNTDEWKSDSGVYLDACVIYKQFWILWIPLWNSDARHVLGTKDSDRYYEYANASDEQSILSKHGEAASAIPIWDKIGGKLVFAAILFVVFGRKALTNG